MSIRYALAIATLVLGISAANPSEAALVTWDLNNVVFADGGTATGFFTFDASTDTYGTWSLTTTATTNLAADGGYGLNGMTYSGSNLSGNPFGTIFHSGSDELGLTFANMLTNAGGTVALASIFETQNSGFESRSVSLVGSVSAVPLPAALPLFVAALLGLFAFSKKKARGSVNG